MSTRKRIAFARLVLRALTGIARIACAGRADSKSVMVGATRPFGVEDYPMRFACTPKSGAQTSRQCARHYHLVLPKGNGGQQNWRRISEYQRVAALGLRILGFIPEPGLGSTRKRD